MATKTKPASGRNLAGELAYLTRSLKAPSLAAVEPAMNPFGPPLAMEAMLQAQRDPELAARLRRDEEEEQATLETLVARSIADGSIDPGLAPHEAASWIRASSARCTCGR